MADLFYDKNLGEESLGYVIKRTRIMVSNDLNTPRVTGCWPQKHLPFTPDTQLVKTDLTGSFIPV